MRSKCVINVTFDIVIVLLYIEENQIFYSKTLFMILNEKLEEFKIPKMETKLNSDYKNPALMKPLLTFYRIEILIESVFSTDSNLKQ